MRLFADGWWARLAGVAAGLISALALAGCGVANGGPRSADLAPLVLKPIHGPQADFPIVLGEPYDVAGVTYTPQDVLNYDEVGFVAADVVGGQTVTGAHHTLPLPSYVEVASLETGRTILVRLERRGPMNGHELIALSPGAMVQLEASEGGPVRVRRVNPPEEQRALLRAGQPAPARMDTPMALVEVLRRKLTPPTPIVSSPSDISPSPIAITIDEVLAGGISEAKPTDTGSTASSPSTTSSASAPVKAGFVVQAAAFSTEERARNAALALGGEVSRAGPYFRVRTGPFATRREAEASLAKVRAAGYTDARIFTSG